MNDRPPLPWEGVDPATAELAEEITRKLQAGEPVLVDAILERHPAQAGALLDVLPTLGRLAELGRALAPESPRRAVRGGSPNKTRTPTPGADPKP